MPGAGGKIGLLLERCCGFEADELGDDALMVMADTCWSAPGRWRGRRGQVDGAGRRE